MKPCPTIALVLPCFNEEKVLPTTINALHTLLDDWIARRIVSHASFVVLVNDGSTDATQTVAESYLDEVPLRIIKLAHNAGHQHALLAGMHYVTNRVDCCITLDADLQDDPQVIETMLGQYKNGADIVYAVRSDRSGDTWFKKFTAQAFYALMIKMGVPLIYNHADFRLLSNKILNELTQYRESNLFLRGIIPLISSTYAIVPYKRARRKAGESKYPFWKMVHFAWNGVTSFSARPLKVITTLGFIISSGCLALSAWVLVVMLQGKNIPGWASITLPLYFLGGIQLLAIGILGEYISRIFIESKKRPHYHVDKVMGGGGSSEQSHPMFQTNPSLEKWW
jgi:polyisoprenyl-phosphate glycosyltransferase